MVLSSHLKDWKSLESVDHGGAGVTLLCLEPFCLKLITLDEISQL